MTWPRTLLPLNHSAATAPMALAGGERLEQGQRVRVDGAEADEGVDHDREEDDEGRDEDLWQEAETEPDRQQGPDGDDRRHLDEDGEREDRALKEARLRHSGRET